MKLNKHLISFTPYKASSWSFHTMQTYEFYTVIKPIQEYFYTLLNGLGPIMPGLLSYNGGPTLVGVEYDIEGGRSPLSLPLIIGGGAWREPWVLLLKSGKCGPGDIEGGICK